MPLLASCCLAPGTWRQQWKELKLLPGPDSGLPILRTAFFTMTLISISSVKPLPPSSLAGSSLFSLVIPFYPCLSVSLSLTPTPASWVGYVLFSFFLLIKKASSSYMFSLPSSATLMDSLLLYLPLLGPTCGDFSNHFHLNIFSPIECGIGTVQCFFGSLAPC